MLSAKPVSTPMQTTLKLKLNDGPLMANASQYRSVVGSLQYLAFTSPDISFAVNRLSQFMHQPTDNHWQAAKRFLRYLAGTTYHGIFMKSDSPMILHAYTDADWAAIVMTMSPRMRTLFILDQHLFHRLLKRKMVLLDHQRKRSIGRSRTQPQKFVGYVRFFKSSGSRCLLFL